MATNPNQEFPEINGIAPSWSDIKIGITLDGGPALENSDIVGVKFKTSLAVGKVKGQSGGRNMKQTTGEEDEDASIALLLPAIRKLKKALGALAPSRGNQKLIGYVAFSVTVQFSVPGDDEVYHFELKGCRFGGEDFDLKPGTDGISSEIPLNPREVVQIIDGEEYRIL